MESKTVSGGIVTYGGSYYITILGKGCIVIDQEDLVVTDERPYQMIHPYVLDEAIYFINPASNHSLEMLTNSDDAIHVAEGPLSNLQTHSNHLLYYNEKSQSILSLAPRTGQKRTIYKGTVEQFHMQGDTLYFTDGQGLYAISSGERRTRQIHEGQIINLQAMGDGVICWVLSPEPEPMMLQDNKLVPMTIHPMESVCDKGSIYYSENKDNQSLYRWNQQTSSAMRLYGQPVRNLRQFGDHLYFTSEACWYSMSLSTFAVTRIWGA